MIYFYTFLFGLSLIGIWYFQKKNSNSSLRNCSIILSCVSIGLLIKQIWIGFIFLFIITMILFFKNKSKTNGVLSLVMIFCSILMFGLTNSPEQKKEQVIQTPYISSNSTSEEFVKSSTSISETKISSTQSTSSSKTVASKDKKPEDSKKEDVHKKIREENTYANGTFVVGRDIPAGEYIMAIGNEKATYGTNVYDGSSAIYSDESQTYNSQLDSHSIYMRKDSLTKDGWFSKASFAETDIAEYDAKLINLQDGQVVKLKNMVMYPSEYRVPTNPDKIIEGMYKVGRDIPEGTYNLESYSNGRDETLHTVVILSNVDTGSSTGAWIKSYQDYSEETYPNELTLKNGEFIRFSDLIMSLKK